MRKPDFCICENKDADQLRSNCAADQRLCFRFTDCAIPPLSARYLWDQFKNPEDRFTQNEAHFLSIRLNVFIQDNAVYLVISFSSSG